MSTTLTLRDIKPGMCWRFTSKTAPDNRNTYTLTDDEASEEGVAPSLPPGWDDHYYEPSDEVSSGFFQKHAYEPVQLLMHYSKAPEGRPLEDFMAVPAESVANGERYLGPWNKSSALAVAACLNRKEFSTTKYLQGRGPVSGPGWVVVWTAPEKPEPFVANPPKVLSYIDPFKDLTDAIFIVETQRFDGRTGLQCLERFEQGQQTESIAWTGMAYVCTNADCGMTSTQVEGARALWALKLKLKVRKAAADRVERDRNQVVLDQEID